MDIFSLLKQEHETVKGIFEEIVNTSERARKTREELYETLYQELHSHAEAEQQTLYMRLEKEPELAHLMAEAKEEHMQAEKMLAELKEMDVATMEWMAKVTVLKENVEHHVKEEEGEMFKKAKKVLEKREAEEIGDLFMQKKEEILEA